MTIDYAGAQAVDWQDAAGREAEFILPMRHHRPTLVRGLIPDPPDHFVVDTGGEVISIGTATADDIKQTMSRKIALGYGTSGGTATPS